MTTAQELLDRVQSGEPLRTGMMKEYRVPMIVVSVAELQAAIGKDPDHEYALAFAKGIKGFKNQEHKVSVQKVQLEALLTGRKVIQTTKPDAEGRPIVTEELAPDKPAKGKTDKVPGPPNPPPGPAMAG